MSPLLLNVFFAAPLEVIVTRFRQDEVIMRDEAYLEETGKGGTPLDRVRRAVWGMLYADDAGVVVKVCRWPCEDDDHYRRGAP